MSYTDQTIKAERIALLNSEERGDVLSWLTSPQAGVIPEDWENEND